MNENVIKLWCPVTKDASGEFIGILSDTSMDRDGEFMSKDLLEDWATKNVMLPALANHQNKMENFIGGWTNLKVIERDGQSALTARPFFFSKEANPLAAQIKKQVEEAVQMGLNPGISIGAIPKDSVKKDIDGKKHTVYTKAELVEATWVPIQSNRNASFGHIARSFDLNMEEVKMEKQEEVQNLPEELKEEKKEEVEAPVEEKKEDAPVEEQPAEEEKPAEEVPAEESEELKEARLKIAELTKKLEQIEKKAVLKGTVEGPLEKEVVPEPSFKNLLKQKYGGQ